MIFGDGSIIIYTFLFIYLFFFIIVNAVLITARDYPAILFLLIR